MGFATRRSHRLAASALAVVALLAGSGLLVACSSTPGAAAKSPAPSVAETTPASAAGPATAVTDVGNYRGGIARTGIMPGPAPAAAPTQLWRFLDDVGLNLPAVVASGLVLVPGSQSVIALDARTGVKSWSVPLAGAVSSPLTVASGTLYATTSDGVVHALDLVTHKPLWTFIGAIDGAQVTVSGTTVYVGSRKHELVALDAATGRRIWSVAAPTSTAKLAIDGTLAVVGGDGGSQASAINLASHKILWTIQTKAERVATPIIDGGSVYIAGLLSGGAAGRYASLYSLNPKTGAIRWQYAPPAGTAMAGLAVTTKDVIIGQDQEAGAVYAINRTTGTLDWTSAPTTNVDRPVVVGDVVYVGTGTGGLHALDASSGHEVWTVAVPGYNEGVVITGGIAFVTGHDAPDSAGTLTALAAPAG